MSSGVLESERSAETLRHRSGRRESAVETRGAALRCEGSHDVGGERRGAGENDIGKALMVWRGLLSGGGWRKLGALAHMPFKHPSSHR